MEGPADPHLIPQCPHQSICLDESHPVPFAQQLVTITKQEHIGLCQRANYLGAQLTRVQKRIKDLEQKLLLKDAKIKDLRNRLFGKKNEKGKAKTAKSEQGKSSCQPNRNRGQQSGSRGHGRTQRAYLPVVHDEIDLAEDDKKCLMCGLPPRRNPGLDEQSDVIEVEVQAYIRRYHRPAYTRNPGCRCEQTSTIMTAPPPPRLIPRSPYGVSFWVDIILSKFRYGQPINRTLQDLNDQGLPVSPGTVADGLQRLAALFEPVQKALHTQQMGEELFHNDETR